MASGSALDQWRAIGQDGQGRTVFYLKLSSLDGVSYTEQDLALRAEQLASQHCCAGKHGVWIVNTTRAKDQRGTSPAFIVLFFPESFMAEGVCVLPNNAFQKGLQKAQKQRQHVATNVRIVHLPQMATKFPDLWTLVEAAGK